MQSAKNIKSLKVIYHGGTEVDVLVEDFITEWVAELINTSIIDARPPISYFLFTNSTSIFYGTGIPGYFLQMGAVNSIVFSDLVTVIDEFAFDQCTALASLNIPPNLTDIYTSAFANTEALVMDMAFPATLIGIGENAFFESGITGISFAPSENEVSIGIQAFAGSAVVAVYLPNVYNIGEGCFSACGGLVQVEGLDRAYHIPYQTFANTNMWANAVTLTNIQTIGAEAFLSSGISAVDIGAGCTDIGDLAFSNCGALTLINCYATTAPTLGTDVFSFSALTEINVPIGATGYGATYGGLTVLETL